MRKLLKVITKNNEMLQTTTINNWEKELDDFYKGEAKKFATESPEILSISLNCKDNLERVSLLYKFFVKFYVFFEQYLFCFSFSSLFVSRIT